MFKKEYVQASIFHLPSSILTYNMSFTPLAIVCSQQCFADLIVPLV